MRKQANYYYLKTFSCWLQIGISIIIYIVISLFSHYLLNPFIPGAIIAIYMTIIVIGGHLQGRRPGLIIGLLATLLSSLFKFFLNDPNFIFEFASVIPHGIMGYIAGALGNRKNSKVSSLVIIPGHLLNLLFFGLFGLISFDRILWIIFHIGFIAETMLDLSIIILGINLFKKHFYNYNRLKTKKKYVSWLKNKLDIPHRLEILNGFKIFLLLVLILLITICVYSGEYRREDTRFYLILYLIPIIFSGYWFGLIGSLPISALCSIIIAHEIFFPSLTAINKIYDQITFFIIFFNLVAIIIGELKRKWETSRLKIKDMKSQEEKYHKMLSHFLSNYLQKTMTNLELLKKEYEIHEVIDQKLIN
ncbi:MAG: hypothetical protein ACOC4M_01145, partial [Promethearchaeia archaeon]